MSTAKIQAAIDALPHATGGEWKVKHVESTHETRNGTPEKVWAHFVVNSTAFGGVPVTRDYLHRADVTLIAAAKDLAEEVVRLRGLVKEAYLDGQRSIQDAIPRSVVPSDPLTFPESVVKEKLNAP